MHYFESCYYCVDTLYLATFPVLLNAMGRFDTLRCHPTTTVVEARYDMPTVSRLFF